MGQMKRKDFAHYFDTATSGTLTPEWELEGIGVEALSLSYNPQIDTFKQIIDDVASSTFDSYQIQSIQCLNCGSMTNANTNTAEFDIQLQIEYKEE